MLPTSQSVQNVHSAGLMLQPPPRSRSTVNLAAAAAAGGAGGGGRSATSNQKPALVGNNLHSNNGSYVNPGFLRSSSTGTASPPSQPHGYARSIPAVNSSAAAVNEGVPPPSPRLAFPSQQYQQQQQQHSFLQHRSASSSHPPSHTSPALTPTLHHSQSVSHFGNYDSRMVANTINKIESTTTLGNYVTAASGASSGSITPTGATQGPESDAWTAVCIRTLPLFNGEGQKGYIEDLNDLVSYHIKRTVDRAGKTHNAINALTGDLADLLAMGMLTLNAKLTELSDERLLVRVTEVWNFFFIGCLPYIEGIFLPLRTDNTLRAIVSSVGHHPPGRSLSFNSSTIRNNIEAIDIRRLALRAFRDHLVLPIVDRLAILFSSEPSASAAHPAEPSSNPGSTSNVSSTSRTASARRLQMVSILIGVQSNDERQSATEALGRALRAGLEKQPSPYSTNDASGVYPTGQYGSVLCSYAGKGDAKLVRDAERKAWRRGRQVIPQDHSSRGAPHGTRAESVQTKIRLPLSEAQGQAGGHFLDHLRTGTESMTGPSPVLTSRDVPEVAVVD